MRPPLIVLAATVLPACQSPAPTHTHSGLHFTHPLVIESPSPDTKVRLDAQDLSGGEAHTTTARLEAEYAFAPALSVEVDVPYTHSDPRGAPPASNLDEVGVALKMANFAFAEHGLLLAHGLEIGLPTGNDAKGIGSSHEVELEPFLGFGYRTGELEAVGFTRFGLPTNLQGEEASSRLAAELALSYHLGAAWTALLELDSEGVLSGAHEGRWLANLSPGLAVAPLADRALRLGLSVGFPLADQREFATRVLVSAFYHF